MARPKKQVTAIEFNLVYQYFRRLFDQRDLDQFERSLINPDSRFKAEKDLNGMLSYNNDNEKADAMQEWIDQHVTPQGVKLMWQSLRQRKYHRKTKPAMVAMDPEIHHELKQLAKSHKLTLSEMVKKLMDQRGE